MELAVIISIAVPALTWAMQWGQHRTMAKVLDERIDRLDRSVSDIGRRVGDLEGEIKALRAVDQHLSRPHRIGGE